MHLRFKKQYKITSRRPEKNAFFSADSNYILKKFYVVSKTEVFTASKRFEVLFVKSTF